MTTSPRDPLAPVAAPMNNAFGAMNPRALMTEEVPQQQEIEKQKRMQAIDALRAMLPNNRPA